MSRMLPLFLICLGAASAQPDAAAGRRRFEVQCGGCHGADGGGGERGPSILARGDAPSGQQLRDIIRNGKPAAGMPAFDIPEAAMDELLAYIATLRAEARRAAVPEVLRASRSVTFEEIVNPRPGDWPSYHGSLTGNRHSTLKQIHTGNVAQIVPGWLFTIPGTQRLQVTPVVVDGIMYVTAVNEAYALDARNGKMLWRFRRPRAKGLAGDSASGINRGVAILGDSLFLVTDHAHLLCLDRHTGEVRWDAEMADYRQNYGATSAPLIVKNLVVSGISGGDEGVRGFLAAYDASSGKEVWRFWTVPAPGEPLANTWVGKDIEHGCATTWMPGTYDPALDLLYWTTGNPCPDYNGDHRQGDNLYSSSVLAMDPDTGALRWYYQYTPHDLHDWDAQQTPMLIDAEFGGRPRRLLVQANRNGFFYVLDRVSGELLLAKPFVEKMTWARGIGADGRPQVLPGTDPTPEGVRVCPAVEGATNWMSTAYHPAARLFYVMALEKCSIYTKSPATWEAGKSYYGGGTRRTPGEIPRKFLRAIDVRTGETAWELAQDGPANTWGGVLSTDGGLVFFGHDSGAFAAADAKTGRLLWQFDANQSWKASPMTYSVDGAQHVAVAAGPNILVFRLPQAGADLRRPVPR
ncbi:MAG: PQQ-dependent dehydrogenase, methanol/ethanol family [Bryobacteraceae bacterium]